MAEADQALSASDNDLLKMLIALRTEAAVLRTEVAGIAARVAELVQWKHHDLPPIVFEMKKDIIEQGKETAALSAQVARVVEGLESLGESVRTMMAVPQTLAKHEESCVRARAEDIQHRDNFEKRVDERFDASDAGRRALHEKIDATKEKIDATRNWVVGGVISTLLTLLGATGTIIWVIVQKGGLRVFYP